MLAVRFAVLAFLCAGTAVSNAGEAGMVLSGIYEYTARPDDKVPFYSNRCRFEITIVGCSWVINYEDTAAVTNLDILYPKATASCDGTNIYFVQFPALNRSAEKKAFATNYDSVKDQLPAANAEIFTGDNPPPAAWVVQKLWFAFASSCKLGGVSGATKPQTEADLAAFYGPNYSCAYYWTSNANGPMTRQIALVSDGYKFDRNITNGSLEKTKRPPPWDKGYTNGIGRWSQETNIAGVVVPMEFEFSGFLPNVMSRTSGELRRTYTYKCSVTNVHEAEIERIPVALPNENIFVTDRRFEKQGHSRVTYETTNGWLAEDNDNLVEEVRASPPLSLEKEAHITLGVVPMAQEDPQRPLSIIWVVFAVPLCFLILKGLLAKRAKQTNKKE